MRHDVSDTNSQEARAARVNVNRGAREARGTTRPRDPALFVLPFLLAAQPSCVVVGGYSSEGGWYLWPGSLLLTAAALAVFFLLSRRRR